jgi:hypothetical protein
MSADPRPLEGPRLEPGPSQAVVERRAQAARARGRRLLAIDLGLAALIALLASAFGPGLALVALVALAGLLGCAFSYLLARRRRRRHADADVRRDGRPVRRYRVGDPPTPTPPREPWT